MPVRFREKIQAMPRKIVLTQAPRRERVAAGILLDAEGRVLITDRTGAVSMRDFWEFPGGKLMPGEAPEAALQRELSEELGISVESFEHFQSIAHEYPEKVVVIDFFLVSAWSGTPSGIEGQQLSWMSAGDLDPDVLLPADLPVVESLRER